MSWEGCDKVMPVALCPLLLWASPEQTAPLSPAAAQGLGTGSGKRRSQMPGCGPRAASSQCPSQPVNCASWIDLINALRF